MEVRCASCLLSDDVCQLCLLPGVDHSIHNGVAVRSTENERCDRCNHYEGSAQCPGCSTCNVDANSLSSDGLLLSFDEHLFSGVDEGTSRVRVGKRAASYNNTRISEGNVGRPRKEILTSLPTLENFADLSTQDAAYLVKRVASNEASRRSRHAKSDKLEKLYEEKHKLNAKRSELRTKSRKLKGEIDHLYKLLIDIAMKNK